MGGRLPNSCFMKTFLLSFIFWLFYNFLYKWIFWNTKTLWKHVFHNCIFKNSLVFIRWVFIKWEQNYIAASTFLSTDNIYFNVNIWFKKSTDSIERWKSRVPKRIGANRNLHKPVLNKIMTTQEQCVKHDFIALL